MMLIRPTVNALLAATLVLLGSATSASASALINGPSAHLEARWIAAPCATGEFTGIQTDTARNSVLAAQVEICGYYKSKSAFALVTFKPEYDIAFTSEYALVPHQAAGPQEVSGVIRSTPLSGTLGVCIMRGAANRIACVRLTFHLTEQTTMEPISTDDPLVVKPVTVDWDTLPVDGLCGSCVDLPV
jgi:hypothetical protein